jgi:predicted alpha/beta-fold hydrolase
MSSANTQFGKITQSSFTPSRLIANGHIQTIFPKFFLSVPVLKSVRERIITPDGDFVDLSWFMPVNSEAIVVLFHGLEGSANSHYIQHLVAALNAQNIGAVVMHFRGCSGEPNLTSRAYHSGATFDPLFVVPLIAERYKHLALFTVGFSLGGNMLMKLMAHHPDLPIRASVCVSAPLDLGASSLSINNGFSRLYQWHLMKSMKANLLAKMGNVDMSALKVSPSDISAMQTFREFDDNITAILHGFDDADDYYAKCSALPDLHAITKPTLIIHAKDDPFMDERVIPTHKQISSSVAYEMSEHGGHVGFLSHLFEPTSGQSKLWLPTRITNFIREIL